jgi:hypothetical protein
LLLFLIIYWYFSYGVEEGDLLSLLNVFRAAENSNFSVGFMETRKMNVKTLQKAEKINKQVLYILKRLKLRLICVLDDNYDVDDEDEFENIKN